MRVGVRALRHRRDRCDRAPARPHRTPTTVRAVAEASIEAAGKNALYRALTNPYYAGVIRYKGALHPGAHEPIVEPAVVRPGAITDQLQSLLKARNPALSARPPPQGAVALRHLRVADAARLRDEPARDHLRLLHLLRPCREEDQLHATRGARAGCGTAGRGLLRQHHDQ